MTEEKQKLLNKIHMQLREKKKSILRSLPVVHELDDGFAIRFFSKWDYCEEDERVKYRKIDNLDTDMDVHYQFFLPKGTILDIKKRDYAGCVICLSGHIELYVNDEMVELRSNQKKCLSSDIYHGRVLRDTYLITRAKSNI